MVYHSEIYAVPKSPSAAVVPFPSVSDIYRSLLSTKGAEMEPGDLKTKQRPTGTISLGRRGVERSNCGMGFFYAIP